MNGELEARLQGVRRFARLKSLCRSWPRYLRALPKLLSSEVYSDYTFLRDWPQFKERTGYRPQLLIPTTFNEKLQWLKLFDRDPAYWVLADKYGVRRYVVERLGEDVLNPLIGVFDSPDEITESALPESFVLKTTHGSGWNVFCHNKADINWEETRERLKTWLSTDYAHFGREWVYKNIPRRIIAEPILLDENGQIPRDYKVFCFHGSPRLIQVDVGRYTEHQRGFYTPEWKLLPLRVMYPPCDAPVDPPHHLDKILASAATLSKGLKFIRVDFYDLPDRIVFGEMTFYPEAGTGGFQPLEYDYLLGSWITL